MAKDSSATSWVHYWAIGTCVATLGLLAMGGLVTSHGAGLAVPDWPNTFGYNMFLFPISKWVGGIFYEHLHRLWASGVGLLTIVLAVGLAMKEPRLWVRRLGWLALFLVVVQGVLGGLRVIKLKDEIGIFHACLAQAFFVLIGLIALFTSRWWQEKAAIYSPRSVPPGWARSVFIVCCLIYLQLALGATMRHAHLGLAIPDFPTMYNRIVPPLNKVEVEQINELRLRAGQPPTTIGQIHIHVTHRVMALIVLFGIVCCVDALRKQRNAPPLLLQGAMLWVSLVAVQFMLGAMTVWTNKAADIATAHVAVGALTLFTGVLLTAAAWRVERNSERVDDNTHISDTRVA